MVQGHSNISKGTSWTCTPENGSESKKNGGRWWTCTRCNYGMAFNKTSLMSRHLAREHGVLPPTDTPNHELRALANAYHDRVTRSRAPTPVEILSTRVRTSLTPSGPSISPPAVSRPNNVSKPASPPQAVSKRTKPPRADQIPSWLWDWGMQVEDDEGNCFWQCGCCRITHKPKELKRIARHLDNIHGVVLPGEKIAANALAEA